MTRTAKAVLTATIVAIATAALPAGASAGIWTPVTSGTTSAVTAIEYQSESRFWFTTADGAIFKRRPDGTFTRELDPIGVAFNDIEFQPGEGVVGLAVGDGGKVYRSSDAGESWAPVTGIPASNVGDGSGNKCTINTALGDVHFVRFAGAGRVWIGAAERQIVTSQPVNPATVGDTGTWIDANRKVPPVAGDNCYLDTPTALTDMAFSSPDVAYIAVGGGGDAIFFTTNNLKSEAVSKPGESANGMTTRGTLAIDPANPNRLWGACGGCPYGNSGAQYTEDGYGTSHWIKIANGDFGFSDGPFDVDYAGGTVVMAGNAGMILTSIDGRNFFKQPADADLQTQDWRAVGVSDGARAAVGGTNGKLVVSATANTVPDLVKPTGTIAGPSTAAAGTPVTLTAQVADEPGGSGINPASLAWTTPGLTGQNGATATFIFPNPGTFTVTLAFADVAGNANTATKSITITPAAAPVLPRPILPSASRPPVSGKVARRRGRFIVVPVKGRLGVPAGVSRARACTGTMSLSVYKGTKRIAGTTTPVRSNCRYKKTIKVKRSRVGRATRVKLKTAFRGNAVLAALSSTYSIRIKR